MSSFSATTEFHQLARVAPAGPGPREWVDGANVLDVFDLEGRRPPIEPQRVVCTLRDTDGSLWLGSPAGLVRRRGAHFDFLAGPRWLPHDSVRTLGLDEAGALWVGTPAGHGCLRELPLTLAGKADLYQSDLAGRPSRSGFVAPLRLPAGAGAGEARQRITGSDGLTTGMAVAAEAFRFAVTRELPARERAWASMQALLRLEELTGVPGLPARAIAHESEPGFAERDFGEWHASPVEPGWHWMGDTPASELVGHFLAFHLYNQFCASADERTRIQDACRRIMDHILSHGYRLVDVNGRGTKWGTWAPEKLNDDSDWWAQRGVHALQILAYLRVAANLVGDFRYDLAYRELVDRYHYAQHTLQAKVTDPLLLNHEDDQLAFLSFYLLLSLEWDVTRRNTYLQALRSYWLFESTEGTPPWNLIASALTNHPCDLDAVVQGLQQFPLDLTDWPTRNAERLDLDFDPNPDRFGRRQLLKPLPFRERPMQGWGANPFHLDGGDGTTVEPPTLWLLPYWLARYHKLIAP